jgi:hypothetical protein
MVQGTIEWSKRASATAALIFSRSLGNTLGVAVLGAALNLGVIMFAIAQGRQRTRHARSCARALDDDRRRRRRRRRSEPQEWCSTAALHLTFWVMLGFAAITALLR